MSRVRLVQNAFNSGEIDPLLLARNDFIRYKTGLARSLGFLPLRQGPFTRAPGTIWRGETKSNVTALRIPFIFAANDAVELEFTEGVMRVWRYGVLVLDGADPFELVTPYLETDLPNIDTAQNGDLIYIADGRNPVQKLSRYDLDNWTIEDIDFESGPFQVQNLDETLTLSFSAQTGAITVTASAALFEASHVGTIFRVQPTDFNDVSIWLGNYTTTTDSYWRYDGNIYQLTAGTNTGVNAPIHTEGTVLTDQEQGAKYTFVSDETGIIRITGFTDSTTVTAEVLRALPKPAVDDPTYRWSEGAWSDRAGWPSRLAIYERRLWAAGSDLEPRTLWASTQNAFLDFMPSTEADGSFAWTLDGDGEKNRIVWLKRGRRGLFIGALGEVLRAFSNAAGEAIGPTTFETEIASPDGSADIQPMRGYGDPAYVTADKARLQEIRYSYEVDGSGPIELSLPSQHIAAKGIEQVVWQSSPGRNAWMRLANGNLACMVYDPAQEVLGWTEVPVAGGFVEDLCLSPSATGGRDVVTCVVLRTIDGLQVRYVEELAENADILNGATSTTFSNNLFASYVYSGASTDTFSVPHLAGETVSVWTDIGALDDVTVAADGALTLIDPVEEAVLGLFDVTHYAETLPLIPPAKDGDARGRKLKIAEDVALLLHQTAGAKVDVVEREFGTVERTHNLQQVNAGQIATNEPVLTTGVVQVPVPSGHADDVRLRIRPRGGEPLTILALVADVEGVSA